MENVTRLSVSDILTRARILTANKDNMAATATNLTVNRQYVLSCPQPPNLSPLVLMLLFKGKTNLK